MLRQGDLPLWTESCSATRMGRKLDSQSSLRLTKSSSATGLCSSSSRRCVGLIYCGPMESPMSVMWMAGRLWRVTPSTGMIVPLFSLKNYSATFSLIRSATIRYSIRPAKVVLVCPWTTLNQKWSNSGVLFPFSVMEIAHLNSNSRSKQLIHASCNSSKACPRTR